MHHNRLFPVILIILTLVVVQLACDMGTIVEQVEENLPQDSGGAAPEPTAIVIQSQPPTPDIDVPQPQPGTGNVVGRILWNNAPVAGDEVLLCEEFGLFSGCEGVNYAAVTDGEGYYIFSNVAPGEYALAVRAIDSDTWLYVTEGLGMGADKFQVLADETLRIPAQSIYKFDLVQLSPAEDAAVPEGQPMLTWQEYPGAAWYEIYLNPDRGRAVFVNDEIYATQIVPQQPLLNCEYTWQIEAYNAEGDKIAEHDGYMHFTVTGQPYFCDVPLLSPQDGAVVNGQGLELSWEAHGLASFYRVHIWDADYTDILDAPRVDGTAYTVGQDIVPGAYTWYITAYDGSDSEIARSDFYEFTVP